MISASRPVSFKPHFSVVSVYLRVGEKFLLLKRSLTKLRQPGKWGVPAGRKEPGESPLEAAIRELLEETGISVSPDMLGYREMLYVRYDEPGEEPYDFEYHVFELTLSQEPTVTVSDEHTEARLVTKAESLRMDLIHDLDDCIRRHL